MNKPLHIALVTCLWGRAALSKAVMDYYDSLEVPSLTLSLLAVYSPGDPDPVDPPAPWSFSTAPNSPLSQKWNAGIEAARTACPDAVVLVGSDDLLNRAYFEYVRDLPKEVLYSELSSLFFYDLATGACAFVPRFRVHPGRMFRRELLDRCYWRPYCGDADVNVDSGTYWLTAPLAHEEKRFETPRGVVCVDVKTGGNIWSYEEQRRKVYEVRWQERDGAALMDRHFPGFLQTTQEAEAIQG